MFNWYGFDRAYKKVFGEGQYLTAADVLVAVLDDHTYSEVRKMHPWELEATLLTTWEKIYGNTNESLYDVFKKLS